MGYLTEQISEEVGRLAQERGRDYFKRGAVEPIEGDRTSVRAVVQGTLRYDVEITSIDEFLDYSCTCPFFERDLEPCKHIWATVLAAEERGYLRGRETGTEFEFPLPPKAPPGHSWKKQLAPLLESLRTAESRARLPAAYSLSPPTEIMASSSVMLAR